MCCTVVVLKTRYFSVFQFHLLIEGFQLFSEKLFGHPGFLVVLIFNWQGLDVFGAMGFADLPIAERESFSIPERFAHSRTVACSLLVFPLRQSWPLYVTTNDETHPRNKKSISKFSPFLTESSMIRLFSSHENDSTKSYSNFSGQFPSSLMQTSYLKHNFLESWFS